MISRTYDQAQIIHDGPYRCPTYGGRTIACHLRIVESRWNSIVIATDVSDSIYSSITLHTEELAATVCDAFDLNLDRLLWIEHIPARPDLGREEDLYDLVHFDKGWIGICRPYWIPLTVDEVDILTDGLIRNEPVR